MSKCTVHPDFFNDGCAECKNEYAELKGYNGASNHNKREDHRSRRIKVSNYSEFNEERAKKLYEELILQYVGKRVGEQEAAERARAIIKKQCMIRGIEAWPWL